MAGHRGLLCGRGADGVRRRRRRFVGQHERAHRQRDAHPRVDRPARQRQRWSSARRRSTASAATPASLPAARPCRSTTARPAARWRRSRRASPRTAHFVVVAYESGGVVRTTVIAEDTAAPVAGTASLRVFDAATDAGAIDVYVTDPATDITTLTSPTFIFAASTIVPGERLPGDRARHLSRARHRQRQPGRPAPRHARGDVDQPAGRGAVPRADDRRHARQRCRPRAAGRLHRRPQHQRAGPPRRRGGERGDGLGERGRRRDRRQRRRAFGRRLRARSGRHRDQRQRQRQPPSPRRRRRSPPAAIRRCSSTAAPRRRRRA